MPYYKKIKQLLCACLLGLLAMSAASVYAAGNSSLVIENAELLLQDDGYELNADVDIKFNPEIERAIIKGFELNFLVEFQLVSPRKYWFDDEIVTVTHPVTLSYHALSRQYLLMRGDQQKVFATLEEAKQALSEIRDVKVLQKSDIEKGEPYKAILLMRLDHSKLPKALQVETIGSDEWKIHSQRFEWVPNFSKLESAK
ncbi:MAG: DUF4390 domain-containing protein [Pseudomonadota bacterium]